MTTTRTYDPHQRYSPRQNSALVALFACFFIFSFLSSIQAKEITENQPPEALAELPFTVERNMVVLNLPVAQYQLNLLLDTGASTTALFKSSRYVFGGMDRQGKADVILPIVNVRVPADRLEPYLIRLGPIEFSPESPLLLDRKLPEGEHLEFAVDGVLGQDFFLQYVVEIDPKAGLVRLFPRGADLSGAFRTNARLTMRGNSPHILFQSRLPWESRKSPKLMLFDTGYPGTMMVWSAHHFEQAALGENSKKLQAQNKGIATFANFRVGKLVYIRTPIYVSPTEPQQSYKRDGLLGAGIFANYHYVIDLPGKRLMLAKGNQEDKAIDPIVYIPTHHTALMKQYDNN